MIIVRNTITRTFAVALVLVLTATGLWAAGAEEEPAAAADKKYVTDPATGKVVSAPEYGGTITYAKAGEPPNPDYMVSAHGHGAFTAGVLGRLVTADWATPRDKHDFVFHNVPTNTIGGLAESWSQPDPLTYIVKVRQGVHWHDKAPMNGRELTADDIEFNYHRILGLGSGFTERSERASSWKGMQFESITATDKWTVVFKLKELNLRALAVILDDWSTAIYPPEVIREHGDVVAGQRRIPQPANQHFRSAPSDDAGVVGKSGAGGHRVGVLLDESASCRYGCLRLPCAPGGPPSYHFAWWDAPQEATWRSRTPGGRYGRLIPRFGPLRCTPCGP